MINLLPKKILNQAWEIRDGNINESVGSSQRSIHFLSPCFSMRIWSNNSSLSLISISNIKEGFMESIISKNLFGFSLSSKNSISEASQFLDVTFLRHLLCYILCVNIYISYLMLQKEGKLTFFCWKFHFGETLEKHL